jgi:menaquinone-dependent protoporphyrinogen IX oxidase
MRTLIAYESMFGHTHAIAEGIAAGLRPHGEVRVVPVAEATEDLVAWADLVVVGGPTHVHGMARETTRKNAAAVAAKPDSTLRLDPDAEGPGVREWLASLNVVRQKRAAAFDTRVDGPALLTGRASGGIANGLQKQGFSLVADPESFLVDRKTELVEGELERATRWGATLEVELVPAR